jgi:hypothetical protein
MKKIISLLFISLVLAVTIIPAQATNINDIGTGAKNVVQGTEVQTGNNINLSSALGTVINSLFLLVGSIFLVMVFTGGFIWMTAGGNEEKVGKAKGFIFGGINGMVVIFLSYTLVYVVLTALQAGLTSE